MQKRSKVVRLRSAVPADADVILWLEEVCLKAYAKALWGKWNASATSETLDISIHEMIVISDKPVGCIATRSFPDSLNLAKLYLSPEARNQGIGASVLRQILARANATDRPVRLRVLTKNPAVRFYERSGFHIQQRTCEHVYMVYEKSSQNQEIKP